MKIGVVGLGLIGGSLAKALNARTSHQVIGYDTDPETRKAAELDGIPASSPDMSECDIVFVCLHPQATVEWARNADLPPGTLVADTCGVKRYIRDNVAEELASKGLRYVGTHPMAGREVGGYKSSLPTLFEGGSWILTWDRATDEGALATLDTLFRQLGAVAVPRTTAEEHDRIIAYTSQMAHVVSNAYVKNEAALEERGFSAGSFQDLTRVAQLDPSMWTELFIANADDLVSNLDEFLSNVEALRDSIRDGDAPALQTLLSEGSSRRMKLTQMEQSRSGDSGVDA